MKSKTWFTSDWHLDHNNILKFDNRPWESIKKMNDDIIYTFNQCVRPNDLVYFLGDFSLKFNSVLEYLPQCNGKWIWIKGNHDNKWWKGLEKKSDLLGSKIIEWYDLREIKIQYKNKTFPVSMSHYPLSSWEKMYYGSANIHGHCHGNFDISTKYQIDVSINAHNYLPISFSEMNKILQEKKEYIDKLKNKNNIIKLKDFLWSEINWIYKNENLFTNIDQVTLIGFLKILEKGYYSIDLILNRLDLLVNHDFSVETELRLIEQLDNHLNLFIDWKEKKIRIS